MTPTKALELVHRYSEIQWAIRACQGYIAEALDKCTGMDGKRLIRRAAYDKPPYAPMDDVLSGDNEKQIHLSEWYRADIGYDGDPTYIRIDAEQHQECIHCFAAHCQIQKRKAFKRQFGSVKAAMTRTTPKPKILDWKPDYEPRED